MSTDDRIWIGLDGERYGPYSEDEIRQWLREGRATMDTLAWREGMADWAPLGSFFAATVTAPIPPPMPPSVPLSAPSPPWANGPVKPGPFGSSIDAARATLPEPPSLHWGLVLLFGILTLGLFGIFWAFTQAAWTRKIDARSNAVLLIGLSLACFLIGEPLYFIGIFAGIGSNQPNTDLISLGGLLLFGRFVLSEVAYFSMAGSLKRCLAARGNALKIGGVTLFFFTLFYLQANLSWVARWKRTGQTTPKPSRAAFWAIFLLLPFAIGVLAAIAIPAYQQYVKRSQLGQVRAQVSQGFTATDGARNAMLRYYESHHAFPVDSATAGFTGHISATDRSISGVQVSGGAIIVSFDTAGAVPSIRQKTLVLLPVVSNGKVSWNCSTYSTVPSEDLPSACQD